MASSAGHGCMIQYALLHLAGYDGVTLGFMLLALIWEFDFPPFMVLIIAILNDGTIMTISKDHVKPSPQPDSWKLSEIFTTGIVLGGYYLAMMTVIFFWAAYKTNEFREYSSRAKVTGWWCCCCESSQLEFLISECDKALSGGESSDPESSNTEFSELETNSPVRLGKTI